ncbi:MAG: hypothetical protein OEW31_00255 [Thermoleophilia bacterium]|nr:hypothetical protein [Thermoleophilia bacterium]MDH4344744.1 hypothetical protein [Thermoleophilia bacterium]MDH5332626.1 hypothetical protein [Thermoleophilia bacterium]
MYSRVTQLEVDTVRFTIDDAVNLFSEHVLPALRELDGFQGIVVLATPEGKGEIITFWDTQEEAAGAAAFGSEALEQFVTLFRAPAGREQYEVVLADLPETIVH